ncbi:MAG: hypothetical protein LBC62_11105, partial [Treponema sp.]|nr:hypothetical protein [Treponema sp.]
ENLARDIESFTADLCRKLTEQNNISITCAGSIAENVEGISRAYYEAYEALGYKGRSRNMSILCCRCCQGSWL